MQLQPDAPGAWVHLSVCNAAALRTGAAGGRELGIAARTIEVLAAK